MREDNFVRTAWVKVTGRKTPKKYSVTIPVNWRRLRRGSRMRAGDKWFDTAGWRWVRLFVDGGMVRTSTLCIRAYHWTATPKRSVRIRQSAQARVDARLIASAPDMLAALERAKFALESPVVPACARHCLADIDAAIAKATGKGK